MAETNPKTTTSKKKKLTFTEAIAIITAIGIIGWIITDFYGGMFIWFLTYGMILIPIVLLYTFSFLETLFSLLRNAKKSSRTKLISHGAVLITILIFNLYTSELFKSEIVFSAILKDDLYHYRLVFRQNGQVDNQVNGMFGFTKTFNGQYTIKDSLIVFTQKPYDNDFIPDSLLIDRDQGVIFMEKDSKGNFRKEIEWFNHLVIEK